MYNCTNHCKNKKSLLKRQVESIQNMVERRFGLKSNSKTDGLIDSVFETIKFIKENHKNRSNINDLPANYFRKIHLLPCLCILGAIWGK